MTIMKLILFVYVSLESIGHSNPMHTGFWVLILVELPYQAQRLHEAYQDEMVHTVT